MSRLSNRLNELNRDNLPLREIADRAVKRGKKISFSSVRKYMNGEHPDPPSPRALSALAAAFGVPVSDLEEAATFTGREPFTPDPSSDRLTAPQRTAVNEIIRLLAEGNTGKGEGNADSPTPIGDAGGKPAAGDGSGDNVRPLRPGLESMAAYDTGKETEKERLLREESERENESQDPDDWE